MILLLSKKKFIEKVESVLKEDNISISFKDKYKRAIVTGAAGFIGSHIVERLLKMEIIVIAIDNFSAGKIENLELFLPNDNLLILDIDVSNFEEMEHHFSGVDIVFHNAASKKNICLIDPARDLEINSKGTLNIMLLAKKYGVKKVVHASTGSVYGEPTVFPVNEEHPINPTSYYGVSKLAGERYVDVFNKLHQVNTTILRYFHVYGPRQETDSSLGGVVAIFINNLIKGLPLTIHGDGNQIRSFTFVEDIVNANLLAAISPNSYNQVYNVASGIKVTIKELSRMLLKHFQYSETHDIQFDEELLGDIKYFDIDNTKIRELGMEFTPFDIGLIKTINYFKSHIL